MNYYQLNFKIPQESEDYDECSKYATDSISLIINEAISSGNNKIILNTNLKYGLPMENINKIAGPLVEAWAYETFHKILDNNQNGYKLTYVEAMSKTNRADIVLQFQRKRKMDSGFTAEVDVKSTSEDIKTSGKAPNLTSFARIRSAYVEDPDYLFIILSLKHRVYSTSASDSLKSCIMEIVGSNVYDLKYLSEMDISFNPALGTGQLQVRDIHYVSLVHHTAWDFCQLLDWKCIKSKKGYDEWYSLAKKHKWIKEND